MNILLATDGSDCARQAIEFLQHFPCPQDSRFTLMTVLDKEFFKGRKQSDLDAEQRDRLQRTKLQIREEGERFLEQQTQTLRADHQRVDSIVRIGHPAEEIVLCAHEISADLVVVGSHGLTAIKRFLLGSVSDQVLAYAPCSVLVVKQSGAEPTPAREQALRILLAYDGSKHSKRAVEFMAGLPLKAHSHVRAISVLPVIRMFRQDIKQRLSWVWQEKKLRAEKELDRITHEVRWGKPEIKTQLREGEDVSQEILDAAEQDHSDLIVLGDKGKRAVDRFVLGSVTTRIAHHAHCSVLAVRIAANSA